MTLLCNWNLLREQNLNTEKKIIERAPPPLPIPSTQHKSRLTWKICKIQTVSEGQYKEKSQSQEGRHKKHWRDLKPLVRPATTCIRRRPTPGGLTGSRDCSVRCQKPTFFPQYQIISTTKSLSVITTKITWDLSSLKNSINNDTLAVWWVPPTFWTHMVSYSILTCGHRFQFTGKSHR